MNRDESTWRNDVAALEMIAKGRLVVDMTTGEVFSRESKTPLKALGAPNRRGYLRTCITSGADRTMLMIHRVVWIAAYGLPPKGMQINHIDGVKANNKIANLEAVSPAANNAHARRTGLWRPSSGLANGYAKLSDKDVERARGMKRNGVRTADIARFFALSEGYTRRIVSGAARCSRT